MTRKFSGEQLVIATHNQGKLEEIRHLFEPFKINIIGANQLNITEPEETRILLSVMHGLRHTFLQK